MVISFYEPHDTPEKDKIAVIVNKQGQVIETLLWVEYVADYPPSLKIALYGLLLIMAYPFLRTSIQLQCLHKYERTVLPPQI